MTRCGARRRMCAQRPARRRHPPVADDDAAMRVAILAFDGFAEIDTFVLLGLHNQLGPLGWRAELAAPASHVTSMNGITVQAQRPLELANDADAVILTGSLYARAIAKTARCSTGCSSIRCARRLAPRVRARCCWPGSACSHRAGTEAATRPWIVEAGVRVLDAPFHARGPVATAGGSLAAQYLAAWLMLRGAGRAAAARRSASRRRSASASLRGAGAERRRCRRRRHRPGPRG